MNCYVHNDRTSIGTCVGCGKFICEECNTEIQNKNHCKACVNEIVQESKKKIEKLEDNKQPMVFMNAGGGAASSSSSSSSSSSGNTFVPRPVMTKSRMVASLLAIFFGGLGIHKFYLGKTGQGILYLIFSWAFLPSVIGLIEGIAYLLSTDEAFAMKHDTSYIFQSRAM